MDLRAPFWLCRHMQSTNVCDLVHNHLVREQHSVQASQATCHCLCRQGATVEHILSKIQQEVEILRRMQGRPEALRLHAVFEVRRGCCGGLASDSRCQAGDGQSSGMPACSVQGCRLHFESCICPSHRCTCWALLLPRGAAHMVV